MEEDGMKTRTFRYEDYNNRRVFLRSYPLQWEAESCEDEDPACKSNAPLKSRLIAIFQWGEGKVLVLRRLKSKVAFYLVACYPFGLKAPNQMLTA